MPATWMLLYGAGVTTGGAFSIRLIPAMGLTFMLLGALLVYMEGIPHGVSIRTMQRPDILLACAFGGVHIFFGTIIAARHGG